MQNRRNFLVTLGGAALGATLGLPVLANPNFPSRPISLAVGFPPGGPLDLAARLIIEAAATRLGVPAVVENRPGASGMIAAQHVVRLTPDGHGLLLGVTANLLISRYLYSKMAYDPDADLVPVAQFALSTNVIYANAEAGITSIDDLMESLKAAKDGINYASPGNGTTPHLTFELVKASKNLNANHIPFRGSQAAINGVVAGEVPFGIDAAGPTLGFVKAGNIVPLAQSGASRSEALPDTPTFDEVGLAGIPTGTFLGIMAPKDTPAPVLALLESAVRESCEDTAIRDRLLQMGLETTFLDGSAFGQAIAQQRSMWRDAVKHSGASAT